ncbi:MAG: PQQ-binding-like beta-propeller repeat protein [Fuerstiella sp.]
MLLKQNQIQRFKSSFLLAGRVTLVLCAAVSTIVSAELQAEDWDQFRGPTGNGMADVSGTPTDFSADQFAWQTEIPGVGWSSPIVAGNQIWLTTAETVKASEAEIAKKKQGVQFAQIKTAAGEVTLRTICVHSDTGDIIHNIKLATVDNPDLINPLNSYASPTCVVQDGNVICHFGSYGTWSLNRESGDINWKTALVIDHSVGPGSSPVIAGSNVLIVCDGIDQQYVAALNVKTGEQQWKTDRPPIKATNGEFRKAYSTPLVIDVAGQTQAVIPGAQWMCAYDPKTGNELWRVDCGDGFSTTPMAVYESGLVICSTGFMAPELVAINPSGSGDITATNVVWRSKQGGSTMPTAVAKSGLLYSISDNGILTVLNATTGKIEERQRIGGKFASSPLLTNDALYLGSQEGVMTVLKPVTLDKLASNTMDSALMASPAIIGTDLIVRTEKKLARVTSK